MSHAKGLQSHPPHSADETETAVWIMIVILLGLACLAFVILLRRVGG